jgi:hypothetical protein
MAEGVTEPVREEGETLIQRPREEVRVHRLRFAIAYLALAVLAGVAVGATILATDDSRQSSSVAWSTWQPEENEAARAKEIGDYVATRYTHPDGSPLVLVFAGEPSIKTAETDVPIRWVAIRGDEAAGEEDEVVETSDSVMYVLCGGGDNCTIDVGEPSAERYRLLRREALELALYSFKYTDADSVIALLPPSTDTESETTQATTLFFQKDHFNAELSRPLQMTLSRPDTTTPVALDATESLTVDRLTRPHLFTYEYRQAQEGSAVMLLAPVALAASR